MNRRHFFCSNDKREGKKKARWNLGFYIILDQIYFFFCETWEWMEFWISTLQNMDSVLAISFDETSMQRVNYTRYLMSKETCKKKMFQVLI